MATSVTASAAAATTTSATALVAAASSPATLVTAETAIVAAPISALVAAEATVIAALVSALVAEAAVVTTLVASLVAAKAAIVTALVATVVGEGSLDGLLGGLEGLLGGGGGRGRVVRAAVGGDVVVARRRGVVLGRVAGDGGGDGLGGLPGDGDLEAAGRVEVVGQLDDVAVVVGQVAALPGVLDLGQHGAAVVDQVHVGRHKRVRRVPVVVEHAAVALVPEVRLERVLRDVLVPHARLVARLVAHRRPHVGAHVPPAQRVQPPVGLDRRDLAVVVVVVRVLVADEARGQGAAEEEPGDVVAQLRILAVGLPGNVEERVLVDVGVGHQIFREIANKRARHRTVGVVSVVVQVGSDEDPLRESSVLNILVKPVFEGKVCISISYMPIQDPKKCTTYKVKFLIFASRSGLSVTDAKRMRRLCFRA